MATRTRRPAFTLIELLVVVSIIAVLAALVTTAAFAVRRGAQKQNAEATLTKIDDKLQRRIKETEAKASEDVVKRNGADYPEVYAIMNACGQDKDKAKAVLLYARLRRDLPMTFAEAKSNFTVCGFTYRASTAFNDLPNSPSPDPYEESAACLYAAVAQDSTGTGGLEGQIVNGPATGQKVFTDGFGMPIAFVRLGYDGNAGELNKPTQAFDPFYPNKKSGGYANLATDFDATAGAGAFNTQVWTAVRNPAVAYLPAPGAYPGLKNHTAFCFSAGPNRVWLETPSNTIFDGDNLFSYRLRQEGARGD